MPIPKSATACVQGRGLPRTRRCGRRRAVQQEIRCARGLRRRSLAGGAWPRSARPAGSGQAASEHPPRTARPGRSRGTGRRRWLQPPGALQQQRRGVAAPARDERELGRTRSARPAGSSLSGPASAMASRSRAASNAPAWISACAAASARPARRAGSSCQHRARCRNARRGQAAARLRPAGRAFELGGDVLIRPGGGLRPVPGAPVGIESAIGRPPPAPGAPPPLLSRCRPVGRRAHQRMPEPDPGAELGQAVLGRGSRRAAPIPSRAAARHTSAGRRSARPPRAAAAAGSRGQGVDAPPEALLDAARERHRAGQPEPARQLGRRQFPWQLQQASGLPRVSATIWSRTRASIGPVSTRPAARALGLAQAPTTSSGSPPGRRPDPGREDQADRLRPRRRATNARTCAEARSSHCSSSTRHTSGRC
jgi:hypothetical protein